MIDTFFFFLRYCLSDKDDMSNVVANLQSEP